ncbi:protein TonB-like [Macrobrachium nipponense]|uniref:protein TonB-like n=1 Tax=Macrobrachium nipponense TaxID=159736 RepID=UPI0030C89092
MATPGNDAGGQAHRNITSNGRWFSLSPADEIVDPPSLSFQSRTPTHPLATMSSEAAEVKTVPETTQKEEVPAETKEAKEEPEKKEKEETKAEDEKKEEAKEKEAEPAKEEAAKEEAKEEAKEDAKEEKKDS